MNERKENIVFVNWQYELKILHRVLMIQLSAFERK